MPVFGPAREKIPGRTQPLEGGDRFTVPGIAAAFDVIDVPGHTAGHIALFGEFGGGPVLFCGDTLFTGGCGRLFEGTAPQMADSLAKLAALPDETLVYSGHEYTMANIGFALEVEPDNEELKARAASDAQKRKSEHPTLPSSIGREKKTTPFLRCLQPAVIASANKYLGARASDPVQVFAAIRQWKNDF